ncbi:hypothetical protein ILUMI_21778 [Ignelater luminosus]|uniref:Tetratricopeptide repeat protein n=1 Tax=Ignelater luminosus TaxID=2038154 RepID=A0A8K0G3E6_IGNLU|nr:hypothetical protein ILUMI_21778 [Ignelater luminosus]
MFPESDTTVSGTSISKDRRLLESILNFFIEEELVATSNIMSAIVRLTELDFGPDAGDDGGNQSLLQIFRRHHEMLFLNQGNEFLAVKDYNNAIKAYTNAIKYQSRNATVFYNRGLAYFNLQNYESCIDDAESTINANPNFAPAFILAGDARMQLRLYLDASHFYDQALQLVPGEPTYKQKLDQALNNFEMY